MDAAVEALERKWQAERSALELTNGYSYRGLTDEKSAKKRLGLQWEARMLRAALPMYWTGRCIDPVRAAAAGLPPGDLIAIREMLYTDVAFCWFTRPWLTASSMIDSDTAPRPVEGLLWGWHGNATAVADGFSSSALVIESYVFGRPGAGGTALLVSGRSFMWPAGWTLAAALERFAKVAGADRNDPDMARDTARFVVAASAFLAQKILTSERGHPSARDAARLHNAGVDPLYEIVTLRATDRHPSAGPGESVEWSSRWLVRGHWRQQWYPSINGRLPIWIYPHIKGPEGLPIKPRTTPVFSVTR